MVKDLYPDANRGVLRPKSRGRQLRGSYGASILLKRCISASQDATRPIFTDSENESRYAILDSSISYNYIRGEESTVI